MADDAERPPLPPIVEPRTAPSPQTALLLAAAELLKVVTRVLVKVEPMIDEAIAEEKKGKA